MGAHFGTTMVYRGLADSMVSSSTEGFGAGSSADLVHRATALVLSARPELAVDGRRQCYAAIARAKMGASAVAVQATVVSFPDVN